MAQTVGGFVLSILYTLYILCIFYIPFILGSHLIRNWMRYIRERSFAKQDYVLLGLRLPKEVSRSPVGMEIFFTSLDQTGATTLHETYWQGKIRPTFSMELASINGEVKFFIWTRRTFRNIIESQIYAHYPNVEISEVEDYTKLVQHDRSKIDMWGTIFTFTKSNVFPIRTYIDYGLDKEQEEETKIDPMTSVLEYLGSLKKGEQAWIQIIIQAHKKEALKEGRFFKRPDWTDAVKAQITKIREEAIQSKDEEHPGFPNPTKGQQEVIAAMERNLSKKPFETIIRGFYISEKDIFNANLGITGLIGAFRQYDSNTMNGFKLGKFTDFEDTGKDILTLFGWIWPVGQIMRSVRNEKEVHMLNLYKRRYAFLEPFGHYNPRPLILTTEELATIYHFPGQVASTPTMQRSASKRAEPPPNLPV